MRATIPAAVAVSALALVMSAAPATAGKKKPRSCNVKGSATLALSTQGRVYARRGRVFACSSRTRKRTRLGVDGECQGSIAVSDFRFGRGVLGFKETSCNLDTGDQAIRVINLRTGRTRFRVRAVELAEAQALGEFSTEIPNWAMKRNGSVAWIGRAYNITPEEFQVWKFEVSNPGARLLDRGANIDPDSLAVGLRGTESPVYWRKGGTVFSSTLR